MGPEFLFLIIVYILILAFGVYMLILLAKFLKAGTEAFRIYIDNNRR